jgi:DNA repair protein NreA
MKMIEMPLKTSISSILSINLIYSFRLIYLGKSKMKVDYSKYWDKIKFWKEVIENVKDFVGTSPPSVFVGRYFYPRVFLGILSPPKHDQNAFILDSPEKWYKEKATIDQILNYRSQMIYCRLKTNSIKPASNKLIDVVQELAMSKKQTEVEIELKNNPQFKFSFSNYFAPIGNPAPLKKARLTENPKVDIKVEKIVSDTDMKAKDAVVNLYSYIPISSIQKIFSVGLLGTKLERKFVPTRWSWTAVHNIIGENLRKDVINYEILPEIRVFHEEFIGNHFEIVLLPQNYQYELIEAWNLNSNPTLESDYENYWGRKKYVEYTAGAWYAARVPILEYLKDIKKQAAILLIREVRPSYEIPCGVWVIENAVRGALEKPYETFDNINDALKSISKRLILKIDKYISKSVLLKNVIFQKKLHQF